MLLKIENVLQMGKSVAGTVADLALEDLARKTGFLHKDGQGVWSLLGLGCLVQRRLEESVRGVMSDMGAVECRLACLQDWSLWEGRRAAAFGDELVKVKMREGKTFALAATAEEHMAALVHAETGGMGFEGWMFQIGTKWRDEMRARHGLVRAREFMMMDAYGFSRDREVIAERHERSTAAILSLCAKLGLSAWSSEADCGAIGGLASREIRVLSSLGSDDGDGRKVLEIAHLFDLGDSYTAAFGTRDGQRLWMGCQGIGLSRLLMVMLEARRDAKGFWGDANLSAVDCHVMSLGADAIEKERAQAVAAMLHARGLTVLLDVRDETAGSKFAAADMVMTHFRLVLSKGNRSASEVEVMERRTGAMRTVAIGDVLSAVL